MMLSVSIFVLAFAVKLATASTNNGICCVQLRQLNQDGLAPTLIEPSSDSQSTFQTLSTKRWSNTAILQPKCIVAPSSAEELSQTIKILTSNNCTFAIKSGGHMPIPGYNSISDGVSIDLFRLNQIVLSTDRQSVSIGAGSTWGDAYDATASDNIAFPGGLCGSTGVGGVSIGGGESYFMGRVGWVVDNVLNYQVVLASGQIVDANQSSNPDLYRALKGGGANFGVVSRVDVAAFEHGDMFAGLLSVPATADNTATTLKGITNFTRLDSADDALQVLFEFTSDGHQIANLGMANTVANEPPKSLASLAAMKPPIVSTLGTHTLSTAVQEINRVQPAGFREASATVTFVNDEATIFAIHEYTQKLFESARATVPDLNLFFSYIPQPHSIESHAALRGGNSLGLEGTTTDQVVMFFNPRWSDASNDTAMYGMARTWFEEVRKITDAKGTMHPFLYLNFAGGFQKPFCGYGDDNVRRLRETARKYDPDGVFQTLMPGGFKVMTEC